MKYLKNLLGPGNPPTYNDAEFAKWAMEQIGPQVRQIQLLPNSVQLTILRAYDQYCLLYQSNLLKTLEALRREKLSHQNLSQPIHVRIIPKGAEETPKSGSHLDYINILLDFKFSSDDDDNSTIVTAGSRFRHLNGFPDYVAFAEDFHYMVIAFPQDYSCDAGFETKSLAKLRITGSAEDGAEPVIFEKSKSPAIELGRGRYVICGVNSNISSHEGLIPLRITSDKLLNRHAIMEIDEGGIRITAFGKTLHEGRRIDRQDEYSRTVRISRGDIVTFGPINIDFV